MVKARNKGWAQDIWRTEFDGDSGAVSSELRSQVGRFESEPPYIKLYLDTILFFCDLPSRYNGILGCILEQVPYSSGLDTVKVNLKDVSKSEEEAIKKAILQKSAFAITASLKRIWAERLDIKVDTISHAITDFVQAGVLKRIDRGLYVVNPNMFGRGEWKNIKKIRLAVDFTPEEGCTFQSEIEKYKSAREAAKAESKRAKKEAAKEDDEETDAA